VFHEMSALPEGIEPLAVPPVRALLLDAVRQHFSEGELKPLLAPHVGARLELREDAAELRLVGEDARVARALSGTKSVAEILRAQPKARVLLSALVLIDAVVPVTATAKVQPSAVPAPRAQVRFAREVVVARKPAAAPASASNETTQLRFASDEAPAAASGGPQDEAKARLEAEQWFQQGRKLLEREKFHEAAVSLEKAIALWPQEPEYRMVEAWASYLAARVVQRIARAKAVACARKVVESDARAAKPHAILGRLLLEDGDAKGAAREFELALVRDPKDEDAKKGLAQARKP
jgi:tetratricopeptide (TPR) repeat protein